VVLAACRDCQLFGRPILRRARSLAWHGTLSEMGMVVISSSIAVGRSPDATEDGKPTGEGGKALSHAFPRFADDLVWWMEAAKAQREKRKPPY
jgi:hypothetical protein